MAFAGSAKHPGPASLGFAHGQVLTPILLGLHLPSPSKPLRIGRFFSYERSELCRGRSPSGATEKDVVEERVEEALWRCMAKTRTKRPKTRVSGHIKDGGISQIRVSEHQMSLVRLGAKCGWNAARVKGGKRGGERGGWRAFAYLCCC